MTGPYFAEVAALMGDPARANILAALMDGRAQTAKELAFVAGVSAPTTSGHLAKLVAGHLLSVEVQGRHRYYRLADPLVAAALEGVMALAAQGPKRHRPHGPADDALRHARTCYDHLAGQVGVGLLTVLLGRGHLAPGPRDYRVTASGQALFAELGIDLAAVEAQRRSFARPCLDWSERRPHLAGALGAALTDRFFEKGYIARKADTRAVTITAAGRRMLRERFAIEAGT
jgi:DNA-binding transcriptional ArsR family regulator